MIKKFIPNLITLLNMLCGCIAVILAVENHLVFAAIFVGLGIFFDFFDGLAARKLGVAGPLGVQLDSLADVITSGVVPGIVMFQLMTQAFGGQTAGNVSSWESHPVLQLNFPPVALLGLLIALASGYRLAKFNIDTRQTSSFIGLPTPANAILILSLPLIVAYQPSPRILTTIFSPWFLITLTVFSSVLLNAELPLFSLKFKSWDFKTNWYRYVFLCFALVSLLMLQFLALPLIILIYVLFSVLLHLMKKV